MVRKFLLSFNREISGVHQAALLIGLSGIFAKILALFRDRLLAGTFGAGATLDIYFAAFRVPDFLYSLSLVLSTSAAVMPIFMSKEHAGHEAVKKFMSRISGAFLLFIFSAVLIAFFLMPHIAPFIAPGFSETDLEQFVLLGRILLLSPVLLGFSSLVSSVLQAHRRFFIYALSPILYNAGIILGILFFYPIFGLSGLAWGVILGALLHFLVQVPSLISLRLFPIPSFIGFGIELPAVLKLSLPRSAGLGINQLVLLVITAVASAIGAGSIAVFQFAYNLFSIPLGMIGMSYSIATFPSMARSFVGGKKSEFIYGVVSSLRHIIFWSLPFMVLFIVLRAHIVRVILGAGVFSWTDTRLTAAALGIFSISILAQGIILLLVRAFFAAGRSVFPLVTGIISGFLTIALALSVLNFLEPDSSLRVFGKTLLRVEDLAQTSVLILVFAFSAGSVVNAVLLWLGFNKFFGPLDGMLARSSFQNIAASFILGAVSYGALRFSAPFFNLQTFPGVFLHGASSAILGIFFGAVYLWFSKNREIGEVYYAIRKKFWKSKTVSPEPRSASEG